MESLIIKKTIEFKASKEQVWDLVTNPEKTKQYMFGCEVISDWVVGSQINWNGKTEEGQEVTFVKGEIVEIEPGNKVLFTMLDPNMGMEDIPENYARLTYEVSESESGAVLKLIQDFSGTENAEKRYQESVNGWDMIIDLMKNIVEQ